MPDDTSRPGPTESATTASKSATKPRPAVSRGAIAILVCGGVVVVVAGMFMQDIKGAIALRAWSKGEVRQALEGFVAALKSGDPARVKQWVDEEYVLVIEEAGRVAFLRGGPTAVIPPVPVPVARLIPAGDAASAQITFALSAQPRPVANTALSGQDGSAIELVFNRRHGSYRVEYFRVRDPR